MNVPGWKGFDEAQSWRLDVNAGVVFQLWFMAWLSVTVAFIETTSNGNAPIHTVEAVGEFRAQITMIMTKALCYSVRRHNLCKHFNNWTACICLQVKLNKHLNYKSTNKNY